MAGLVERTPAAEIVPAQPLLDLGDGRPGRAARIEHPHPIFTGSRVRIAPARRAGDGYSPVRFSPASRAP